MKTKEKNVTKGTVFLLSFVAFLVFCSFVVSYQITDILYFFVLISYIVYYIMEKKCQEEEEESIR